MKVTHFPADQGTNPYQSILIEGLRDAGIRANAVVDGEWPFAQLTLWGDADILHLHWMHSKISFRSFPVAVFRFLVMHICIAVWRFRGKKIVWTIHQLQNHERRRLWLDRVNSRLMAWWSAQCIVHGRSAIPLVVNELGIRKEKLSVMLHPNYGTSLTSVAPPLNNRGRRKILFFGMIRKYKNVPQLIKILRKSKLPVDLRICGMPYTEEIRQEIEVAAEGMQSVQLDLHFISETDLEKALADSDIVALPFSDIFTSGSLIMAMTAARPVIAPRAGLVADYVDEDCAYLYDLEDEYGLLNALTLAVDDKHLQQKGQVAYERSLQLSTPRVVEELIKIYHIALESKGK